MIAIVVIFIFAVIGLVMALISRKILRASRKIRAIFLGISLLAFTIVATDIFLSQQYPGPFQKYQSGSFASFWRMLIPYGAALAALLPLWVTAGMSSGLPENIRIRSATPIAIGILAALVFIPGLYAVLFIACNHAGACL
jgi:uncharacterized membrane protein